MIKSLKSSAPIIFLSLLIFVVFIFSGCNAKTDYSEIVDSGYSPTTASVFVDDLGYNSVKLSHSRDIKILQLSDLHVGNGILCVKKDTKALEDVCKLIEYTCPDLIVITGDLVYPISLLTGTNDNLTALKVIARIIERYKTPWTICFGNHDAEICAQYSKSELCEYLESDELEYCLFERGPSDLNGMGNHIVNIYNNDNSINSSIIIFDNGEYNGSLQYTGYRAISQSQTDWYANSLSEINDYFQKNVQSFIYFHIPSREYEKAWKEYREGNSSDVEYFYGWANEKNEKISCPDDESPLFEAILELGSTKGIFCGHNHLNDFSISYKGVRLTFGKSIDYIAYAGIVTKTEQRGCTLLKLKGLTSSMSENFEITSIKVIDIE